MRHLQFMKIAEITRGFDIDFYNLIRFFIMIVQVNKCEKNVFHDNSSINRWNEGFFLMIKCLIINKKSCFKKK